MFKVWLVGVGMILACAVLLSILGNVYHPSSNNGIAGASDTISSKDHSHPHPREEQEDQHPSDQQHSPEIREAIRAPI
jgi:hypothetical protein